MAIVNLIAFIILAIGGLNWGLVGIFRWNLVEAIFGGFNVGAIIIYVLVLLATLWLLCVSIATMGRLIVWPHTHGNDRK